LRRRSDSEPTRYSRRSAHTSFGPRSSATRLLARRFVRFGYIIDASTELSLSREWWDDLGRPEAIYVEVKPDPDDR
jgi:hypothetical protein